MEYRLIIFYVSLFLSVLCVAEIYVRLKGIGAKEEKVRGEMVRAAPKIGRPIVLFIAAVATAVMTIPK